VTLSAKCSLDWSGRNLATPGKQLNMLSVQHGEREYVLDEAARRAHSTITELGLTAEMKYHGGDPTVWGCRLLDNGSEVAWAAGQGKGTFGGARVGALYEALEHYVVQQGPVDGVALRPCGQIAESALATEAYAGLLAEQPDNLIACRIYQQIDGSDTLAVPLFLSNVWWVEHQAAVLRAQVGDTTDYHSLARYSSNNGSAIGGSFAEATVHAINEAIERDASSLFFLDTYVAGAPPRFYDIDTLPHEVRSVHEYVQDRVQRTVWIIDLTSDLGVPTTLAYAPGTRGSFLRGYGTSLSRHHSIYRALTELLEGALSEDTAKIDQRCAAIDLLSGDPLLQSCAAFELDAPTASTPRTAFVDSQAPYSPQAHLGHLLAALTRRGFNAYTHTLQVFPNGITAVHIHIPGLEHFHLIADGPSPVVPGRRGLTALSSRQ
jgi:ribosomal protein S12 methylthiotransferase accessory factor